MGITFTSVDDFGGFSVLIKEPIQQPWAEHQSQNPRAWCFDFCHKRSVQLGIDHLRVIIVLVLTLKRCIMTHSCGRVLKYLLGFMHIHSASLFCDLWHIGWSIIFYEIQPEVRRSHMTPKTLNIHYAKTNTSAQDK